MTEAVPARSPVIRFGSFSLPPRHLFWLLFGLAFFLRVAGVVATKQYQNLEHFELERVALSFASTGVFGNPYAIPTGPSAHVSPAYPLVLAVIFKLFGSGIPGEIVKEVFACAVTALQCALMPALAVMLRFSPQTGIVAGLLAALSPLKLATETQGDWESNWAALAVMAVAVLIARTWHDRTFTLREAVRYGCGWGACLLVTWTLAPLYAAVLIVSAFFVLRGQRKQYLAFSAAATICIVLWLSPWILRNWLAFHAFVPGRTNTGIELRISNNSDAVANGNTNYLNGLYEKYHPLQSASEARKVLSLGEVEYNRQLVQETRSWISAHPARFVSLTLERFALFWFYPDPHQLIKSALLWARTALGLIGFVIAWRINRIAAGVLTLIVLIVPLPNYLVHIALKHSYPIDWILTLLAGLTITSLAHRCGLLSSPALPQSNRRA